MSIRQELAQFCAELTYDSLPADVIEYTKFCFLDHVACMLAAPGAFADEFPAPDIAKFIQLLGGKEESGILGWGGKFPSLHATFTNTAMCFSGFDAFHKKGMVHAQVTLFPAATAVAERQQASGKELLMALVLGTEVMARVGMALDTAAIYKRGFHPTALCAPLGCAIAAGKLLGLGQAELAEALSLAAIQGAGSSVWGGGTHPTKPISINFQMARAAESGVLAAMMADIGLTGIDRIFEHERGFLSSHCENPNPSKLTHRLGETFEIKELLLHKFPFGPLMFTAIEALHDLMQENRIAAERIEKISVWLPNVFMLLVGSSEYPKTKRATFTNTRYAMAANAYAGSQAAYGMELMQAKYREDPQIMDLFNRTEVMGDPILDEVVPEKEPCILTIRTKDGSEFSRRNDGPVKGDPQNPFSKEEAETKFNRLVIPLLGKEKSDLIASQIWQLEKLEDISGLVDLWAGAKLF